MRQDFTPISIFTTNARSSTIQRNNNMDENTPPIPFIGPLPKASLSSICFSTFDSQLLI